MYKLFAKAYFSRRVDSPPGEEFGEELKLNEHEHIDEDSESYIAFTRTTAAIGMSPKPTERVANGAMIDTGSIILSSVGLTLSPAVKLVIMRNISPLIRENQKKRGVLGSKTTILRTLNFFFHH